MADGSGSVLVQSPTLLTPSFETFGARAYSAKPDTCAAPCVGCDAQSPKRSSNYPNGATVASQAACCSLCNNDADCASWVYGTEAGLSPNCWPLSRLSGTEQVTDRVTGGLLPPSPPPSTVLTLGGLSPTAAFLGAGTDGPGAQTLARTGVQALVENKGSWTPSFWCSDGFSMLAVSPFEDAMDGTDGSNTYPVKWAAAAGAGEVSITVLGGGAGSPGIDLYLSPAVGLREHVASQAALEGYAPVPPRYAMGFFACRWGWVNQSYIEGVLAEFRSGAFPIDSMISDFEWFTAEPDYSLPSNGSLTYHDFLWNNITWPPPQAPLVARYRSQYNIRFGGIRKPRYGNATLIVMAAANGWLMGQDGVPGAVPDGSRNLNYSMPAVRSYYSQENNLFLEDGVQFWWNDEGEDDYFTFTEWTQAEVAGLRSSSTPTRRFFSINRAFAPGAAALGVTVWTGDIAPSWGDLQNTPGYVINWALAGAPFVTCDIGGFNAQSNSLLLARWYGVGVFMPIMRVHSVIGTTPHFPFPELWGEEASGAMRVFLEARYALLPHTYALAYDNHLTGVPPCRAMRLVFPDDAGSADLTLQWMLGDSILVAPVLSEDNTTSVYLPGGGAAWYPWGGGAAAPIPGPTTIPLSNVPLDVVPVYVRAGAVLALAPPVQYSDALPGGPLHVTVYAGADATFTVYDDDGETTDYETAGAYASVALTWDDGAGCLSWARSGGYPGGAQSFLQLDVTAYTTSGAVKRAAAQPIGTGGKACPV